MGNNTKDDARDSCLETQRLMDLAVKYENALVDKYTIFIKTGEHTTQLARGNNFLETLLYIIKYRKKTSIIAIKR